MLICKVCKKEHKSILTYCLPPKRPQKTEEQQQFERDQRAFHNYLEGVYAQARSYR